MTFKQFLILACLCIESRLGRDFPHPSRPNMEQTQPPPEYVSSIFLRLKWPVRGAEHPSHQSPKSKSISKLLSPLWNFMAYSIVNFTYTAHLPKFIMLIYPHWQSPVFWCALLECNLPFKDKWLLYVPSILTFQIIRSYIPCFQQPEAPRLQCAVNAETSAAASVRTTANVKCNCYTITLSW